MTRLVYSYVRDIVVCAVFARVYWQLVDGWTAERVVLNDSDESASKASEASQILTFNLALAEWICGLFNHPYRLSCLKSRKQV